MRIKNVPPIVVGNAQYRDILYATPASNLPFSAFLHDGIVVILDGDLQCAVPFEIKEEKPI